MKQRHLRRGAESNIGICRSYTIVVASMPTRRDRSRVQAYDIKGMFPKRGFLTRVYIVSTRKTLKQERHQWRPERREAKSGDTS